MLVKNKIIKYFSSKDVFIRETMRNVCSYCFCKNIDNGLDQS